MFKQKLIYVCSPLKGDIEGNVERAKGYCKTVIEMGYIPIAPHVMYRDFLNDEIAEQRERGLEIGLELIKACDETWVFTEHISDGMKSEILLTKALGKTVKRVLFDGGIKNDRAK